MLDGQHATDAVVDRLQEKFAAGTLSPPPQGDDDAVRVTCKNLVDASLERLARYALLIG
jgi:methyltransferase-like protein